LGTYKQQGEFISLLTKIKGHRLQGDLISLLLFYQNRETRLKKRLMRSLCSLYILPNLFVSYEVRVVSKEIDELLFEEILSSFKIRKVS
jgi:hypothetical protein